MAEERDRQWLDGLAGRGTATAPDAIEGASLRRAIQALLAEDGAASPARDRSREDALIARARSEGLLEPRRALAWWATRGGLALAAVVMVAAVGLWLRPGSEPPVVRGASDGVVRLEVADPPAERDRLVGDLRDLGVAAVAYDRFGRAGVDADLPQPLPAAVRQALERRRIPLPADGVLRVEFGPAGRP